MNATRHLSAVPDARPARRDTVERAHAFGPITLYERDEPVHRVFARQVSRTPNDVAVIDDLGTLSYADLDRRANRLARHLQAIGIPAGSSIGVAFERSRELPVTLLAILKASCAYVPLDATYPAERIAFILADATIPIVIVDRQRTGDERFGAVRIIDLEADAVAIDAQSDAPSSFATASDALAYVMYTSGSTGRPKGVAISHRGIVRLVRGSDYFESGASETFLQFAPAAFDASTFEIWGALLNGARLAIPPAGLLAIADLGAAVERLGVTTLWLTASLFARVVEAELPAFAGLRQLLTGGSAGSPRHMVRFLRRYPACRLIAGYGPTENTTFSTTYHLASEEAIGTNPPIGRPIANSSAYVVDENFKLVARGIAGELCVGGDGVALGYLNLPAETRARFVPDPFAGAAEARLYRTGDRVRMRTDGVIEFLGRTDDQVKINGYRIELGEIEAALRAHPEVRDAAVVAVEREPGEKTLSAHVVAIAGSPIDEPRLRDYLRAKLPAYMVPPRLTLRAELPLHPSGKVNRVALATTAATAAPMLAPKSAVPAHNAQRLDGEIFAVWREALHDDSASDPHANFFDAGGDSIRLLRLQSLLNERLQADITVLDLFEHTTVAQIAGFIATRGRS